MGKAILDANHMPLLDRLMDALETESDPVRQQSAIELLTVQHAMRGGDRAFSRMLAERAQTRTPAHRSVLGLQGS